MCRLQSVFKLSAVVTILLAAAAWTQPPTESPATVPTVPTATTAPQVSTDPETVGDVMLARRRYQAAIEAYKKVPQPTASIWNKMGISYQMMFDLEDAMRCYQASLKLDPKNVSVLNNLGTVYDSQKDYGKAVKMYRKALKIQPKSALILKNLGTDLLAQHKYEKGWEVYKSALDADPQIFDRQNGPRVENPASVQDRGAMNYYMAKGCVRAGRNEQAIEYLRSALSEGFTSPQKVALDREFAVLHGLPAFDRLIEPPKQQ
ncbi:MAG TPA: tetratricopeptide repeat protein [Terracidiphilus sp.]|nr:tetratricopeptide repeat protein [Terracidiphilus sp.]